MKQTAVEWLKEIYDSCNNYEKFIANIDWEQAKQMEKEQIVNAFNQGYTQCSVEDLKPTSRDRYVDAEDYINKTFKSE